jgi:hypothetical protein
MEETPSNFSVPLEEDIAKKKVAIAQSTKDDVLRTNEKWKRREFFAIVLGMLILIGLVIYGNVAQTQHYDASSKASLAQRNLQTSILKKDEASLKILKTQASTAATASVNGEKTLKIVVTCISDNEANIGLIETKQNPLPLPADCASLGLTTTP